MPIRPLAAGAPVIPPNPRWFLSALILSWLALGLSAAGCGTDTPEVDDDATQDDDTSPGDDDSAGDDDTTADDDATADDDTTASLDQDGDGSPQGEDCDDHNATVYPTAPEDGGTGTGDGDGLDNDCDTLIDEGTTAYDDDGDGYSEVAGDCDDANATVHPGATEQANNQDDDCDSLIDEGTTGVDDDGDGYSEAVGDCDDADPSAYPGAPEDGGTGTGTGDGTDNDCDEVVDEGTTAFDDDEDGYAEDDGDCNDANTTIYPGATETADGIDGDCDGTIDEGTASYDDDGDGFCEGATCVNGLPGDCDDTTALVGPTADEAFNGRDDDCDGFIDEGTEGADDDLDGYTVLEGDCNDYDADVHPFAEEVANTVDDDCDGTADDGTVAFDDDGDGFCETDPCTSPGDFGGDCNDISAGINPDAAEAANGIDDDCDGVLDEGTTNYDDDGDGYSESDGDCHDNDSLSYPGATERVDTKDNDCDGTADEGTTAYDDDADGYCETAPCTSPGDAGGDCNDAGASVHPGVTELANLTDDDCDGVVDEGTANFDDDGDGYSENDGDCDDTNSARSPGATESRDGVDNDCDSLIDDGTTAWDDDNDGYCEVAPCQSVGDSGGDCNDASVSQHPGLAESADTLDNDCDGIADEGTTLYDDDGDGYCESEPCTYGPYGAGDCLDSNPARNPGADDIPGNGTDENCSGADAVAAEGVGFQFYPVTVDGATISGRFDFNYFDADGYIMCWFATQITGTISDGAPDGDCTCDDTWRINMIYSGEEETPCDFPVDYYLSTSERDELRTLGVTHDVTVNAYMENKADNYETIYHPYDFVDGYFIKGPSWTAGTWDPAGIFYHEAPGPVPMEGSYYDKTFFYYGSPMDVP